MNFFVLLLIGPDDKLCIGWDLKFVFVSRLLKSPPVLQCWVASSLSAIAFVVSFVLCSRTVSRCWIKSRLPGRFVLVKFNLSPPVFFGSCMLQGSLKSLPSNSSLGRSILLYLVITVASPEDLSPVKTLKMKLTLWLSIPLYHALYHCSSSLKSTRLRYHSCSYSPITLILDECVTRLELFPCLYSPTILPLDVYISMLRSLARLCSYAQVYDTALERIRISPPSRLFGYLCSPNCRHLPCSPVPIPDFNLLCLVCKIHLVLICRFVSLWMRLSSSASISLGPNSPSFVHWFWSTHEREEHDTNDLFSVLLKGSTLFSAAELEIVKSALDAVTITDGSPLVVFITFTGIIPIFRLNVIEIRGLLYDNVCLCIMNMSILYLCAFRWLLVAMNVAALIALKLLIFVVTWFNI